ncbi:uncharacterized protein [Primulina eburnea]|uniref:uncharacterized protein isoform X1 n=1 Tax=Primulina eburnea TaxID=1245227 RepID=UPI003C6BFB1C
MEVPKGVQRWVVDISKWNLSVIHLFSLIFLLPQHEHSSISRYWCLKEAYVKALGSGVGYKLDDVEFHHTGWKNISAKVAGKELKDWKFWLLELDQHHSRPSKNSHPKLQEHAETDRI